MVVLLSSCSPRAAQLKTEAKALIQMRRYVEARELLDKAITFSPNSYKVSQAAAALGSARVRCADTESESTCGGGGAVSWRGAVLIVPGAARRGWRGLRRLHFRGAISRLVLLQRPAVRPAEQTLLRWRTRAARQGRGKRA